MFGSGKTGRRLQRLLELHSIQFPKLIVLPGGAIELCRFDYDNPSFQTSLPSHIPPVQPSLLDKLRRQAGKV